MFYLLFLARCRGNSKIQIVQVAYCQIQCLFKYNYIIQRSTKTVFEDRRTESRVKIFPGSHTEATDQKTWILIFCILVRIFYLSDTCTIITQVHKSRNFMTVIISMSIQGVQSVSCGWWLQRHEKQFWPAVQKVYIHSLAMDRTEGIQLKLVQVLSRQWKGSCGGRVGIFSSIPTNIFVAKVSIQYLPKAEARVLAAHKDVR